MSCSELRVNNTIGWRMNGHISERNPSLILTPALISVITHVDFAVQLATTSNQIASLLRLKNPYEDRGHGGQAGIERPLAGPMDLR